MKSFVSGSTGVVGGLFLVVLVGAAVGFIFLRGNKGGKVLTETLAEPFNGATSAKVEVNTGNGNLAIDRSTDGSMLASGTLQYIENKPLPVHTVQNSGGQAIVSIKADNNGGQWKRFPWEACNGATDWQLHFNPDIPTDVLAYSGGGNIKLDFSGMLVTRVAADTGGGNIDIVLPAQADSLSTAAKTGAGNVTIEVGNGMTGYHTIDATSGAGNVTVRVPAEVAVRVNVNTGAGKAVMDPQLQMIDEKTYQTAGYDSAADRLEITMKSGMGNVSVTTK